MSDISPEDLVTIRSSAKLSGILPELQAELDGMSKTVMQQMFAAIRRKTLTADEALNAWMELYSYNRLLTRMSQRANIANSVTERLSPQLTIGDDDETE